MSAGIILCMRPANDKCCIVSCVSLTWHIHNVIPVYILHKLYWCFLGRNELMLSFAGQGRKYVIEDQWRHTASLSLIIGSGNGLLPVSAKQLPEPKLTCQLNRKDGQVFFIFWLPVKFEEWDLLIFLQNYRNSAQHIEWRSTYVWGIHLHSVVIW